MTGLSRRALFQSSLGGVALGVVGGQRVAAAQRGDGDMVTAVNGYLRARARAGTPGAAVVFPAVSARLSRSEKDRAWICQSIGSRSAWNGKVRGLSSEVRSCDVVHRDGPHAVVRALEVLSVDWDPGPQDRSPEYADVEAAEPERFGLTSTAPTRVTTSVEVLHEIEVDLGATRPTIVADAYGDWLFSGDVSPDVASSPFMREYVALVRGPDLNGMGRAGATVLPTMRKGAATYNWEEASNYAQNWALGHNDNYVHYICQGVDCANFASQCLWRGGEAASSTWYRVQGTNCGVTGWGAGPTPG